MDFLRALFRDVGQSTYSHMSPASPTFANIEQPPQPLDDITDDSAILLKSLVTALRDKGLDYKKIQALNDEINV